MSIHDNPMGTDGFEFVEYSSADPAALAALFERMGFTAIARHRSKDVTLYRQGDVNFILNAEPESQARRFNETHGPSANAMAFRVADSAFALKRAKELGYEVVESTAGPMELNIPALVGIGGSLVYLVDRYGAKGSIYEIDFTPVIGADGRPVEQHPPGAGLTLIDHLTHNVEMGNMDRWAGYYERLFNFREIRYFDIAGKVTGLKSRAMTSPDGQIRIPLNESSDDQSQIAEYLREHRGEGIQHIALGTEGIYDTVETLRDRGVAFLDTPDTYYEKIETRLPGHREDVARMQQNKILIDGEAIDRTNREEILLQIFTKTVIGPLFFEIIQRKGNDGFGEGNFKALFESIEEDQIRRGVVKA